jgi:hypothetical protein
VIILGPVVEGATSVKFDHIPATFKILSDFEIEANVPEGATTGLVSVHSFTLLVAVTKVPFTTPVP